MYEVTKVVKVIIYIVVRGKSFRCVIQRCDFSLDHFTVSQFEMLSTSTSNIIRFSLEGYLAHVE